MNRIFALFLALLFITTSLLVAQELNCTVTIHTESIQPSQRDYLRNFSSDIERYMNNTHFTNEDLDGEKILCNLDISLTTASTSNQYQAQVAIVSQRPIYQGDEKTALTTPVIRIFDDSWQFTYTPNQSMNHNEMMFDPLTGFLDFYAYLIIGYDLDTYVPLSGSACFRKASNVVQLASNSSVGKDWQATSTSYSKYSIADELSNPRYDNLRTAFNNYYFDGVDLLATERPKALENMLKAIESIYGVRRQNPTGVTVKQFFDAKSREIAEAFQTYPDRSVYETLSNYDEEHRNIYQDWKMKK